MEPRRTSTSKKRSPANRRRIGATSTSPKSRTSRAIRKSPGYSKTPRTARRGTPTAPPEHDPNPPRYWDERDLEQELKRTFQVCQECRMCVTYCGSFPILFDAIDRQIEAGRAEGAEAVESVTMRAVSDHCWQCK